MDSVPCLCINARRAALALTALYDEALAPHGLKVTQFSLLSAVRRHRSPNLTGLAEATGLDRSTLGRNLRVLEGQGLVRTVPGGDRRDWRVELTALGLARLRAAAAPWKLLQERLAATLGEDAGRLASVAERVSSLTNPAAHPAARAAAAPEVTP